MNHRKQYNQLRDEASDILCDLDMIISNYDPDHVSGADVVVMAGIKKALIEAYEKTWYMHIEEEVGE